LFVVEVENILPSGGLRKTINHCIAKVVGLLLSGGLRKTTSQSHLFFIARLMRLRNLNLDYQLLMLFPPVSYKVRRCKSFHYEMRQYSRMKSTIWLRYLLDYWWPSPRSHPPIMVLNSCIYLDVRTFVWRMIMLSTILTRMKIEAPIFHVANSLTMLAFMNLLLNWSRWIWTFL